MHLPCTRGRAIALYLSGLSARDVTERILKERNIYVSPQTVARWMQELGKSRPVGEPRFVELGPDAKKLYESGYNIEEVAGQLRVGKTVTATRLREMGVEIRPSGSRFIHILTEDHLRKWYLRQGMTMQNIAAKTGCSIATVQRLLKLNGIPRRRRGSRSSDSDGINGLSSGGMKARRA